MSLVSPSTQMSGASPVGPVGPVSSINSVGGGCGQYDEPEEKGLRSLVMRAGVFFVALTLIMVLTAGPALAQDEGSGSEEANPAMEDPEEATGEESNDGITGGLGEDSLDGDEEKDYTGEDASNKDPEGDEGGSFAQPAGDGELLYKAYPITHYEFSYYQPEAKFWQINKKLGQASSLVINKYASGIFVWHVIIMRATMSLIQYVLSLNLVENLNSVVSTTIKDLGNAVIGSGQSFSAFVKIVWALGVGAVVFYLFRSRVSRAFGALLQMIVITAISAIIILYPSQILGWYTGITNTMSNTVLAVAVGEDAAKSDTATMPTDFANKMWKNYVIYPWAQIQVSSDPEISQKYAEQALATDKLDRPDALEGIKDEKGVDPRASENDSVMHITWALATLLFGLLMATMLIIMGGMILVGQLIALVAIITAPIWLWFAIFPAGGVTSKMFGWFLGVNIDVILLKLMLAVFIAVNTAILDIGVKGEDMALILRFLLSILTALAVIMLILGIRKVIQEVLSGGAGFGSSGASGMLAMRMASDTSSKVVGESKAATGGSGARGSSYMNPATTAAQNGSKAGAGAAGGAAGAAAGLAAGTAKGGSKKLGKMEKARNEERRAQYGEQAADNRNKKQKTADIGKATAKRAGSIGWKATKTGAGAAGAAAKVGAATGKRLPKAGLMAAKSGFMPMETAAAFGGVGAAAGYGAAAGAMGKGKDKVKEAGQGLINNARQAYKDDENIGRFQAEGEQLTEQVAERKASEDRERYDTAEESARQEYLAANPQYGGEYPEEAPEGMPANGTYHPEQGGIITGNLRQDEMPPQMEGHTASVQNQTDNKGNATGKQYTLTPDQAPGTMRSKAFEASENARPEGPRQAAMEQQQGVVASGYSNYDKYHSDKLGQLKREVPAKAAPGESQPAFETRRDTAQAKVDNYNPAHNPPPATGDPTTGKAPGATGYSDSNGSGAGVPPPGQNRAYPSVEEIKKADPEGFKKFSEPRISQEFSDPLRRSAVEQSRSLANDPDRSQGAFDVTYYMEHARADVREGVQREESSQSIITGMAEPQNQEGPEMMSFYNRARDITNNWQKNGPAVTQQNGPGGGGGNGPPP